MTGTQKFEFKIEKTRCVAIIRETSRYATCVNDRVSYVMF